MKSFIILLSEKQSELLNDNLLQDHITYLKNLRDNGCLPICGPFSDNQGAVLVIRADSKSHAEELINGDPFIKNNYYKKFEIHEFMEANEENDWLANSDQTLSNSSQENDTKNFLTAELKKEANNHKPLTMSVLFRKLKNEKTYQDFREAWLPPVKDTTKYFGVPILVINAQSVQDPSEIISVGLIWANVQEAIEEYKQYQETEDLRHEKIDKVTDQSAETRFCEIINIDVLGS